MGELFPTAVETDRLRMEPRSTAYVDVHEAYRICSSDPGIEAVTRYVPWEPHDHPKETVEFLERGADRRADGETADFVLRPREGEDGAGDIAGFAGLHPEWERGTGVLGIWLRRRYWGRGYSGERAMALAELAFEHLDLDLLAVSHHVDNDRSRRAIEKYMDRMGGGPDGRFRNRGVYGGEPADERRYTVDRESWLEATDGGSAGPDVRFEW